MDAFTTYHLAKIRQRELLDAAPAAHDGRAARRARRAARRAARSLRATPAHNRCIVTPRSSSCQRGRRSTTPLDGRQRREGRHADGRAGLLASRGPAGRCPRSCGVDVRLEPSDVVVAPQPSQQPLAGRPEAADRTTDLPADVSIAGAVVMVQQQQQAALGGVEAGQRPRTPSVTSSRPHMSTASSSAESALAPTSGESVGISRRSRWPTRAAARRVTVPSQASSVAGSRMPSAWLRNCNQTSCTTSSICSRRHASRAARRRTNGSHVTISSRIDAEHPRRAATSRVATFTGSRSAGRDVLGGMRRSSTFAAIVTASSDAHAMCPSTHLVRPATSSFAGGGCAS